MLPSTTNTHAPAFSNNVAKNAHALGDVLVSPCHTGIDQLARFTDPIKLDRYEAMEQWHPCIEVISRPFRLVGGLSLFAVGVPFALIGQFIKILAALDKKDFEYYQAQPSIDLNISLLYEDPEEQNNPINITSWNLAAMHSLLRRFNGTRPVAVRMKEAVKYINQTKDDIVCFQEVFTQNATQILTEGLHTFYPHTIHNVGKNIMGINSGLMIFSKYPFEHIEFEPFEARYGKNSFSQKGVLGAIINKNDKRIVVINMHLEAGGFLSCQANSLATKERQLEQAIKLRDKLVTKASEGGGEVVIIFAGDTNLPQNKFERSENSSSIRTVFSQYNLNPQGNKTCLKKRILSQEEIESATFDNAKPGGDYLGVDNTSNHTGTSRVDYKTRDTSDHFPIRASFSPV